MGSPKQSTTGLSIGSPLSAGAASLVVAVREHVAWTSASQELKSEFCRRVYAALWLDDLLLVFEHPSVLSEALRSFLNEITSEFFYGRRLRLVKVPKAVSFGFRVGVSGGVLSLRPNHRFIVPVEPDAGTKISEGFRKPSFHGGPQFRAPAVKHAVASGHASRLLYTTNQGAVATLGEVLRVYLELEDVGYATRTLTRALAKATRGAWLKLEVLRAAFRWTRQQKQAWCAEFDSRERRRRLVDDDGFATFDDV